MATTNKQSSKPTSSKSKSPASSSQPEQSEFVDSKVAVGAALTFIEDLQTSLPAEKYTQILSLLNKYHTHSLNVRVVYQLFKDIIKGNEHEERLLKGFERFMPEGALIGEEMEVVDVLVVRDEEEGRGWVEEGKGRVEDVTEAEEQEERKEKRNAGSEGSNRVKEDAVKK